MKRLISMAIVATTLIGLGSGCRTGASVKTKHHAVGVGVGAK
jgi:hypothetical protein